MSDEVAGGLDEPAGLQPRQGTLHLATDQDTATRADWEAAAAGVLRRSRRLSESDPDSAVWGALTHTTYDGVAVPPLGTRDLLAGLQASGRPTRAGGWDVRVRHTGDREAALDELRHGATSLWLMASRVTPADLPAALDGVRLDIAPVVLHEPTLAHAEALVNLAELHPEANLGAVRDEDAVAFVALARAAGTRALVLDGTAVHERGASDGQELGWVLARGAALLRSLENAGTPPAEALPLFELRMAATDEQFQTIAKLRAARRLWSRLAELCGVADPRTRIHAVTSGVMTSAYDVHVNLLRTTVAAFAAGVGGADALTTVPFDEPTGEVSAMGRRLSRNISALLVEESHVARVADPAGGAYAVERLTGDVCRAAWEELGRIERDGLPAFDVRVAEVAARRDHDVATRARAITGLSEFPNLADPQPSRPDGAGRWGAAFEALRATPPTAHVFLATLGPVAQHTARAGFAANLLAAGGIGVDPAGATNGIEDLTAAYDGQTVVCLAGTDAAYAEWGSEAADALRSAGAARVLVVSTGSTDGRASSEGLTWADDVFCPGDDAVAFLTRTREALR